MKLEDFARFYRVNSVKSIHAFREFEGGLQLRSEPQDANYNASQVSNGFTAGTGTRHNPYRYEDEGRYRVSPHYMLLDLWFRQIYRGETYEVYLLISGMIFKLTEEGVVAADGILTKFIRV